MVSLRKKQLEKLSQIYRMMGDPSRLKIILNLIKGEVNVSTLCKRLRMSQPTVSRHLSLLKMTGVAEARRDGKEIFYSISPAIRKPLGQIIDKTVTLI